MDFIKLLDVDGDPTTHEFRFEVDADLQLLVVEDVPELSEVDSENLTDLALSDVECIPEEHVVSAELLAFKLDEDKFGGRRQPKTGTDERRLILTETFRPIPIV